MLMFHSKAQFPKDPRTYDTAMYLMCLKLIYGWKYKKIIFEKLGLDLNDIQLKELHSRINKSQREKQYKNTAKVKRKRKAMQIDRLKQNKNYNKDYKNPNDIKKHKINNKSYQTEDIRAPNNSIEDSETTAIATKTTTATTTTTTTTTDEPFSSSRMTSPTQPNNLSSSFTNDNITSGSSGLNNNNNEQIIIDDFEDGNDFNVNDAPRSYPSMMIDGLNTLFGME